MNCRFRRSFTVAATLAITAWTALVTNAQGNGHCGTGLTKCKGSCVNTQSDFHNCGACGVQCAVGHVCSNGVCGCPVGQADCNGACTDLLSNTANCGACGVQCPRGHVCSNGVCGCPSGQIECSGVCIYATTDTNCGTCGNVCTAGTTCIDGACVVPPPCYPYTDCGVCTDVNWDNNNCGSCGNVCAAGWSCQGGGCTPPCDPCDIYAWCYCGPDHPDYPNCGCVCGSPFCNGVCTDTATDNANCGACGNVCPGQTTCTGGTCQSVCNAIIGDFDHDCDVDADDVAYFGTCARGAAIPQTSVACADTRLDNDADVDLDDFGVLQRCYSGASNPANPNCVCAFGQTVCSGACTDTLTDLANCGACGNACGPGLVCSGGTCVSCPGAYCSGSCKDLLNDPDNCGACGHACPFPETCDAGVCSGSSCAPGLTSCSGVCTNLAFDPGNCGACGHVCSGSETTCSGGICQSPF